MTISNSKWAEFPQVCLDLMSGGQDQSSLKDTDAESNSS